MYIAYDKYFLRLAWVHGNQMFYSLLVSGLGGLTTSQVPLLNFLTLQPLFLPLPCFELWLQCKQRNNSDFLSLLAEATLQNGFRNEKRTFIGARFSTLRKDYVLGVCPDYTVASVTRFSFTKNTGYPSAVSENISLLNLCQTESEQLRSVQVVPSYLSSLSLPVL